jgi:hypothetical protein
MSGYLVLFCKKIKKNLPQFNFAAFWFFEQFGGFKNQFFENLLF